MGDYDNDHDNYERDYNEAMKEVRRLRGVAREYSGFYNMVKEALEKQDWDAVKAAFAWVDD